MWSTCLFCSSALGTNEAIETFPVGRRVAFDAANGRLWAVCGRCGRWNLAPLEERWEAVESAERLFHDARTRVHSENIGLARLPDGTRLVRVGKALPGELAAWRYGSQLVSRRRRNTLVMAAAGATGVALLAGMPLLMSAGVPLGLLSGGFNLAQLHFQRRQRQRVVHRLSSDASPTGRELVIRRWQFDHTTLLSEEDGSLALEIRPLPADPFSRTWRRPTGTDADRAPIRLQGPEVQRVVSRLMTDYNHAGASEREVEKAVRAITDAGGPEAFAAKSVRKGVAVTRPIHRRGPPRPPITLRQVAGTFRGEVIPVVKYQDPFSDGRPRLTSSDALALEMALQEEAEREALQGELAALEAAWREAEEIARIADALPGPRPQQQE